ncbi:MAG: hypothetical protein WC027_01225 [Candidatus Paceibacterota bacterium]
MDKFPNINNVSGSVPLPKVEERLEISRNAAREDFKDSEIPPTAEETQVIDEVSHGLKIMLEYIYKIPCKEILKEKIHIVREGTLSDKYGRGLYQSPSGDIYLEPMISCQSKIVFAKVLAHELVHYLSFSSVKAKEQGGRVRTAPHIDGLGILKFEETGVKEYFGILDEAATSYISNKFLNLELNRVRNHPEEKAVYTDECLAVDAVRGWLHSLPDSVGLDKTEWDKYYIISIPFAEEIAGVIRSDISTEEKIEFYRKKIGSLSPKDKWNYYLERTREIEVVNREIREMFAKEDPNPSIIGQKTMEFIEKVAMLKLTGSGFLDIVRFIERRLGRGAFKNLAEKFGRFEPKK